MRDLERLMFMFGSVLSQSWYPIRLLDRQPENSQGLSQPKIQRYELGMSIYESLEQEKNPENGGLCYGN